MMNVILPRRTIESRSFLAVNPAFIASREDVEMRKRMRNESQLPIRKMNRPERRLFRFAPNQSSPDIREY